MMQLDDAIDRIITREGATFTNDAQDKPTKYGITLDTYASWLRSRGTFASMGAALSRLQALERAEAIDFYRWYLASFAGLKSLTPRTWDVLLDCVTLHGQGGAARLLQTALGVVVDGKIGPQTVAALAPMSEPALLLKLSLARVDLMVADVRSDLVARYGPAAVADTDLKYLRGWIDRAINVSWG